MGKKFKLPVRIFSDDEDSDEGLELETQELNKRVPTCGSAKKPRLEIPEASVIYVDNEETCKTKDRQVALNDKIMGASSIDASSRQFKTVLWNGVLSWVDHSSNERVVKQVPCKMYASESNDNSLFRESANWLDKFTMRIFPKHLLAIIGFQFIKEAKFVLFRFPPEDPNTADMTKIMCPFENHSNNAFGYVMLTSKNKSSETKILILVYGRHRKSFVGCIPIDQRAFKARMVDVVKKNGGKNVQKNSTAILPEALENSMKNTQDLKTLRLELRNEHVRVAENLKQLTGILGDIENTKMEFKNKLKDLYLKSKQHIDEAIGILQSTESKLKKINFG